MSIHTHIEVLQARHQELKTQIQQESSRPFSDFTVITALKKRKLAIKEELFSIGSVEQHATASAG